MKIVVLIFGSLLGLGSAWNQPSTCLVRQPHSIDGGVERELKEIKETLHIIAEKLMIEVPTTETVETTQPPTTAPPTAPSEICGGPGWRRVAYFDMTDPSQSCPEGLGFTNDSVRACNKGDLNGRGCTPSVIFPVEGEYSQVCGRARGYMWADLNAFQAYHNSQFGQTTIDGWYGDGLLFSHGVDRMHIWSFVAGYFQGSTGIDSCPCEDGNNWDPPPFVGNDYFCSSAALTTQIFHRYFTEDPLWDDEGCIASSSCCEVNSPPWFNKTLPAPTTDDIEMRLCLLAPTADIAVEQLEIYVF